MSPEQIEGQRGDERSDIYAIGTIFYEMLCGKPPFTGDNAMVVMAQHVRGGAPRLDKVKADISTPLAAVVARCLQREPADRYPNMRALIHDLDHLDSVDTAILNKVTPTSDSLPFWRSQAFVAVAISVMVMAAIVIFALAVQGMR
jgi:serine/threonine-protein kinase